MCVYLGGSCVEDVTTHLMRHLSLHPTLRTCSADTILRAIEELTCANTTYTADSGKRYDFNTADTMNWLLVNALLATGQQKADQKYDFDFDHQFIETEKYDAKPTYKKLPGYEPGIAVIYIRAKRCFSFYDSMFALTGWKKGGINQNRSLDGIPLRRRANEHPP